MALRRRDVFKLGAAALVFPTGCASTAETRSAATAPGTDNAIPGVREWEQRGEYREVKGHRLFVIDTGPRDAPVIGIVHGFPSCSWDFWRVLPALSAHYRVVVHDQTGFGLSAKPANYSYSILDQADRATGLWRQLGIERLHLLAHDYGCSVATELFYRHEQGELAIGLDSATLVNSGLYYEEADIRPTQHLLRMPLTRGLASRLSNRGLFVRGMKTLWGERTTDLDAELNVLWEFVSREDGKLALGRLSHYLEERRSIHKERWDAAIRKFSKPTHVLWGDADPVGVPAVAEKLERELPSATLTWLKGVGHYPMLEAPDDFSRETLGFLGGLPHVD